ncbi:MAG TPA: DUF4367 domain-containing protein [Clostridia bacterium]|nr:DUF4367 domain-containing protein [Clostridia bacterium]
MNKKEEFEILLSQTLKEKAEKIQFDEDLIANIKERILLNKKGGDIVMRLKIMPLWKKAVAAVVITALTMGIALGVSPSARAMASDTFIKFGKIMMRVVEEGKDFIVLKGTDEKGHEMNIEMRKIEAGDKNAPVEALPQPKKFSSIEEAEKYLGIPIKLPSYLPEGYKLHTMMGDKYYHKSLGKEGKNFTAVFINEQNNQIKTISYNIHPSPIPLSTFTSHATKVEEVNINGITGYWIEEEFIGLSSSENENSDKKLSERIGTVKHYHLYWQSNGMTYGLNGQNLTKEEAVKIAESIK